MQPVIWWLNLNAERELTEPSAREPSLREAKQMAERAERFAPLLCQGEPYCVPKAAPESVSESTLVLAWCPTPGALQSITQVGLRAPKAPALSVLQHVNHRKFALELSRTTPFQDLQTRIGVDYPRTLPFEASRRFVVEPSVPLLGASLGANLEPMRLKRPFGCAGRGQWRLQRASAEAFDEETARWVRGALRQGGLLVEPEVDLHFEMSLHGLIIGDRLWLGHICQQRCDAFGAPVHLERVAPGTIPPHLEQCITEAGHQVAHALREAGYFGPFGIDARLFRWRGQLGVHLLGDINARFTLGWSLGLGERRNAALTALLEWTYSGALTRSES